MAVAKRLVGLCREGQFETAMGELYAPGIVSVEAFDMAGKGRSVTGMEGVAAKGKWWTDNHTVHSMNVSDPFMAEDKFAVTFDFDVTFKPTGERKRMFEVGVYTVAGGKVVHEEFLYSM